MDIDREAMESLTDTLRREGWTGDADRIDALVSVAMRQTTVRDYLATLPEPQPEEQSLAAYRRLRDLCETLLAEYRKVQRTTRWGIRFSSPATPDGAPTRVLVIFEHGSIEVSRMALGSTEGGIEQTVIERIVLVPSRP